MDVTITCDEIPSSQRAIKVMFRDISTSTDDVEELRLQDDVVGQIRSELQRMRKYMAEQSRMGDWEIGYLPRN